MKGDAAFAARLAENMANQPDGRDSKWGCLDCWAYTERVKGTYGFPGARRCKICYERAGTAAKAAARAAAASAPVAAPPPKTMPRRPAKQRRVYHDLDGDEDSEDSASKGGNKRGTKQRRRH